MLANLIFKMLPIHPLTLGLALWGVEVATRVARKNVACNWRWII